MKAIREVVKTKEIEVEVNEKCFTDEFLDDFEAYMFKLDSKDTREESLIDYILSYLADNGSCVSGFLFIEGAGWASMKGFQSNDIEASIVYNILSVEKSVNEN